MFFHDLNLPDTYMISPKSGVVHHQAKVFQSFTPPERGKLIRKRAQEETVHSTHRQRYCLDASFWCSISEIRPSLRVAPLDQGVALLRGGFLLGTFYVFQIPPSDGSLPLSWISCVEHWTNFCNIDMLFISGLTSAKSLQKLSAPSISSSYRYI